MVTVFMRRRGFAAIYAVSNCNKEEYGIPSYKIASTPRVKWNEAGLEPILSKWKQFDGRDFSYRRGKDRRAM
jgi:hypothetical protein